MTVTIHSNIAAAARSFEGTPFVHQGRKPGVGLDCAGVVCCAHEAVGYPLVDAAYRVRPEDGLIAEMERSNGFERIDVPEDGAVAILRLDNPSRAEHMGICDGDGFWHVLRGESVKHQSFHLWRDCILWFTRMRV